MHRQTDLDPNKLRRDLIQARTQISDLQEELQEKAALYINAIAERDQLKEQWVNAKEGLKRVETIVQSKVDLSMQKERAELAKLREESVLLKQRMELMDQEKDQMLEEKKQLMDKVLGLNQDLAFYARNVDARESMKRIEQLREEKDQKEREIVKHLQQINECNNNIEDLMAENRILRKQANVPDNYGKNLVEQIKLHDREKIEDYKKLISVLQEDNYKLEEERARLKHLLKQMSVMYNREPHQKFKGLNNEQMFKVDQYILRLLNGQTEDPADFYKLKQENKKLRAQLEALNSKGFEFVKNSIERILKDVGFGLNNDQLSQILNGNEELARLIRQLLAGGGPVGESQQFSGKFRPPLPLTEHDGQIPQGFSYKFDSHLSVVDKNRQPGVGELGQFDNACLQLQVIESLELLKRKDDNAVLYQTNLENVTTRIRDYLLVQDQFYKDFVKMEKEFVAKRGELETSLRNSRDLLHEEQLKNSKLEGLIQTLNKGDKNTIEFKIIELTKQNSILDINLLRLTRKYQTLEEQEQLLRREYHNKEADMAEKDRFVQQRINMLKEWKARAIQQLNFLFQKLRCAVPLTEYQSVQSQLDLQKHLNADLIDRNAKMAQRLAKLETQVRENLEFEERYRNLEDLKEEAENELEIVKKRLEHVDLNYKWENAVFNKIVAILKKVKVSPQQAFEEFDANKDGELKREEFVKALEMMRVNDLSNQEIDILMNSLDTSGDQKISYKEFVHKLSRHGIRSRTTEEQIIYLVIEALKRSKIKNMSEAFALIDKEGRGFISQDDFKDIFRGLSLKIDQDDLDKFIEQFWKDKTAGIDYQQFLRIFKRYQMKLEGDGDDRDHKYVKIPEEIIRLKKDIYMTIHKALSQTGKSLKGIFAKVDSDQSDEIDIVEFKSMFEKMKLKLTHIQAEQIFNSVDFDYSGNVSFPEFISDFEHTVGNDVEQLIREERERAAEASRGAGRATMEEGNNPNVNEEILKMGMPKQNQELQYQRRIAILETREKQKTRELQASLRILKHTENAKNELQQSYNDLDKRWNEMTEEYHSMKCENVELMEEKRHSVRKDDAEMIKKLNEKLQTEVVETKAAMLSYKNLVDVITDQTKGLKLMIERKKDENENLLNAMRDLQSQSLDQQRLGKLYYVVMLSRWQEAAVNKKYDATLTENKELRGELLNSEQGHKNKDLRLHECENSLQDKQLHIEKLKQQISSSKNLFLTFEKATEFNKVIQEISDEKTDLEESYFKLRSKFLTTQMRMDEAVSKFEHTNELLQILEKNKQSELSDKVIEISQKLQGARLHEMKASRELEEIKEKCNYLSRRLKNKVDSVVKLEEQVSEFESKLHRREEEFRRADNERLKRFFNARFDNIAGAIEQENQSPTKQFKYQDSLAELGDKKNDENFGKDIYNAPSYISQLDGKKGAMDGMDAKMLEGQIKKLKEELKKAVETIKSRDLIINRFKEWQLADKYLSQDQVLKDAIDQHRVKTHEIHEQESKEMAEAAYVTIKTLQEMLDQKNEQLKNKEAMIEKVNHQAALQREQDQNEIARLHNQLSLAGDTALNRLQEIIVQNEAHKNATSHKQNTRYERMTREELQRTLHEKDIAIQELVAELKGSKAQYEELFNQKKALGYQNQQLEHNLMHEKQNNHLKAKQAELQELAKKLKREQAENKKLSDTIMDLNIKMQEITKNKEDISEDQNMGKIQASMKINELNKQNQDLQTKIKLQEAKNSKLQKELQNMKIKEQEKEDKDKKLELEKNDAQKALANTRDTLDNEMKKRQALQIEVNNMKQNEKIGGTSINPASLEQLQHKNRELENDILILQCQQKTVVVYNKETATFEYVGEPILLNFERELTDLEEIIEAMKKWVQKNQRLTIRSIFESMDKENFGELTEQKFELALQKIGFRLREKEKHALKQVLDPKNLGYYKYRPLIRELQGIPQLEFLPSEIIKLAKLVENRNLTLQDFYQLIDPLRYESMNLQQFSDTMANVKSNNFEMRAQESEVVFKYITKAVRTTGVSMSVSKLGERVFVALKALLVEQMRDAVFKSLKPLQELFLKHDGNKDGQLEYPELENLFLECQMAFKPNMLNEIYQMLDPGKKLHNIMKNATGHNNKGSLKISKPVSFPTLKFFICDTSPGAIMGGILGRSVDIEPSQDKAQISQETSLEELNICKGAARKILAAAQSNLPDILSKKDINNEGMISREDIQRSLEEVKVKDLSGGEMHLILKFMDKGHKGYVCIQYFLDKLQELASESKSDTMLRRFAGTLKHQGIDIRVEMLKYEQSGRTSRLDRKTFTKAMRQLSIALTDEEIEILFQSSEIPDAQNFLDIKTFVAKVNQAQKSKPLPAFIAQGPKVNQAQSKLKGNQTGAFENWELEKKYKKKLEALQQQIEESKKETQAAEKQSKNWQEMANRLDREKTQLQTRLVDKNAKPPKAAMYESLNQGQLEEMQGLKDQIFYLQQENAKLEKTIQVELKAELGKLNQEREKTDDKVRAYQEEVKRLEYQIQRLIGKPMDDLEKREEGELWRENRIKELEKQIEDKEKQEQENNEMLFKTEEKLLDMKFKNETFDLQYARLQKRITDLEQYKLASSKYSAVLKKQEDDESKRIEEVASATMGLDQKKQQESVKLRSRSTKSVSELEMLVESLKRVIEKQKTENENLQRQVEHIEKNKEKVRSEKHLRQKIENLEQEVHSYEMKDVNVEEKDKTIRKMLESNKLLREDLTREEERYQLLEKKYKELLVKYNVLCKDHAANVEKLFAMGTGGNIGNFEGYLSRAQEGEKKDYSYDKRFDDIY